MYVDSEKQGANTDQLWKELNLCRNAHSSIIISILFVFISVFRVCIYFGLKCHMYLHDNILVNLIIILTRPNSLNQY